MTANQKNPANKILPLLDSLDGATKLGHINLKYLLIIIIIIIIIIICS